MRLEDHPTVIKVRSSVPAPRAPTHLEAQWLRRVVLDAGADDVGFVEIERAELSEERQYIKAIFPVARTVISFVVRMNRDPVRSRARSLANVEFHHAGERVNEIARVVVSELQSRWVRAVNPAMGFPMEVARFPDGRIWTTAHKTVAEAAGLGKMGIHRNVIHPVFGNFVLLGTVIIDKGVTEYASALDYDPCLECKLCVAACPVGAIGDDGHFNFSACYTHNYREFLSGFTDRVGKVADSKDAADYRRRVTESESVSVWQSLSFGANYKSALLHGGLPGYRAFSRQSSRIPERAGETAARPKRTRLRSAWLRCRRTCKEALSANAAPRVKRISTTDRQSAVPAACASISRAIRRLECNPFLPVHWQGRARVHGGDSRTLTVVEGHPQKADISVTADSRRWLEFIYKDRGILWALLTRKIRIRGNPRLLLAFFRCFPS